MTVDSTDAAGYTESWLYDGTKYSAINVPGVAVIKAAGINTAGDIVYIVADPYGVTHGALKSGKNYYIFDYPKGSNTAAAGINDSNLMVGSYNPAGKTVPEAFQGTE